MKLIFFILLALVVGVVIGCESDPPRPPGWGGSPKIGKNTVFETETASQRAPVQSSDGLSAVNMRLYQLETRIANLENTVQSLNLNVREVEGDISNIEWDVRDVKRGLK